MATPGRASLIFVGGLGLLTAGAIALALATAPPVAEQQLHVGAGATPGTGNFVMDLTNTVTTRVGLPGRSNQVQSTSVHFVYQAPDRIDETLNTGSGRTVHVLCIGNERYERTGPGRWVRLPNGVPGAVSTCQAAANAVVLGPSTAAADGTHVVRHAPTSNSSYRYELQGAPLAAVYRVLFGVPGSVITGHAFGAAIDKEYMVSQSFSASAGNQTDVIRVRYSQIGTAPPVEPPPPAALRGG